ncbi:hypothetical protein [Streptomyces indicus]|nr:hypothetical protein [Streptomyces indicus]
MADAMWKAILFPVPSVALAVLYVLIGSDGVHGGGPSRVGVAIAIVLSGFCVSLGWRMCFATRLDVDLDRGMVRVVGVFTEINLDARSIKRVEWIESGRNVITLRLSSNVRVSVSALSGRNDIGDYLEHLIATSMQGPQRVSRGDEMESRRRVFGYPTDLIAVIALASAALLLGLSG